MSLLLVRGTRAILHIIETEVIGFLRLWNATALLALLVCFTSTFIISPKLCTNSNTAEVMVTNLTKAKSLSKQLMGLRIALAIVLAIGIRALPHKVTVNTIDSID